MNTIIVPYLIYFGIFQYEFVYRAISDYVELYMNKEEEYEYSVPVGAIQSGTTKVDLLTFLAMLCFLFYFFLTLFIDGVIRYPFFLSFFLSFLFSVS